MLQSGSKGNGSTGQQRYQWPEDATRRESLIPNRGIPANGLWVGRWREDVIQPDGSITRPYKWEVLGTIQDYPTRKLVLRALEARLSTINSPTYRARPNAAFAEFANRWDATVLSQHKPITQSAIKSQLRRWLLPELGDCALKDLDGQRLQAFISKCDCNSKTIRNLVATLRILAETGIRGGEICALRIADLDLENAVIYVRQSVWRGQIQTVKSRKGNRRLPISARLAECLRFYLRTWRPNALGLLFATKMGTPWDHSLVRRRKFHPLLTRLGIPKCGFHAFRHGKATLMDQIGAPMAVRQDRLGHSEPQTTMGYTHLSPLMNAQRQMTLGEFCTLLHGMNKKRSQHQEC
jgi:integrase